MSLEEAVQPIKMLVPDIDEQVYIAKRNCRKPNDGLSSDESASIYIYTMESTHHDASLYYVLNATLRSEDRKKVKPWFRYLKLISTALYKLPSFEGTVWRSIKADLSGNYRKGETYTWWAFTATTINMEVFKSEQFLGKHGARTLFSIQCKHGKSIKNHAYIKEEDEILLMPGFQFEVLSQVDLGNSLFMINVREIEPPFPLIPPPIGHK